MKRWLGLLIISSFVRAEEEIDLSALGTSDFLPYLTERNPMWLLLPLGMAAFVALHLRTVKKPQLYQEEGDSDASDTPLASDRSLITIHRDDSGG